MAFPDLIASFRGRSRETKVLADLIVAEHPTAVALIGAGGSGKSTLAIAVGHKLRRHFGGRIAWLRVGDWDRGTVAQMMALQLAVPGASSGIDAVRDALIARGPSLIVLDNHESDAVTASVLDDLRDAPVSWIITARRCLLGGVTVFPVVPAMVNRRAVVFESIAHLTRLLRWHPVALDIADALVTTGATTAPALEKSLRAAGLGRIVTVAHEDDVPEVRAVVAEAVRRASPSAKKMLSVLVASRGDHMDAASLRVLAKARDMSGLSRLQELRLIQEPSPGRFALHVTVKHSLPAPTDAEVEAYAIHYLKLLEREPDRIAEEQTHLFALMDWSQERRDLTTILRVQELATKLEQL